MLEILMERKKELQEKYRKNPSVENYIRKAEVDLLIKRYKRLIEAEVDAAGFREELGNLVVLMSDLESV